MWVIAWGLNYNCLFPTIDVLILYNIVGFEGLKILEEANGESRFIGELSNDTIISPELSVSIRHVGGARSAEEISA